VGDSEEGGESAGEFVTYATHFRSDVGFLARKMILLGAARAEALLLSGLDAALKRRSSTI
jgi:hypothetical protein